MRARSRTEAKETRWVVLLALAATLLTLFAIQARPAGGQQYGDGQYGGGQGPVTATGVLGRAAPHEPDPAPIYAITDEGTGTGYELTSGFVELEPYVGERVTIEGVPVPGNPPPGAPLFLNVTSITPADGSETPDVSIEGTITDVSGSVVLVEEDPSAESGDDKGYFTVTGETEITKQEAGGSVPAAFEDLEVGQLVEAAYEGDVATSYPTQGNARGIAILEDPGPAPEDTATLSFELTARGTPPADASFSGFIPAEGGIAAPLSDPDGDGRYTGSVEVDRYGPGSRPVPPGTEPVSLPAQIVQDGTAVIRDFGLVRIDGDKTFRASISFGGGTTGPDDPGNDPAVSGDTNDDGGDDPGGGTSGGADGIKVLPNTGGLVSALTIAFVLIASGLVARRIITRQ